MGIFTPNLPQIPEKFLTSPIFSATTHLEYCLFGWLQSNTLKVRYVSVLNLHLYFNITKN